MPKRVVVTGLGALCPLGLSFSETWQNCLEGYAPVAPTPSYWHEHNQFNSKIWSPLPEFDFAELGIPKVDLLRTDPVSLLSFLATKDALKNANLTLNKHNEKAHAYQIAEFDPTRTGIYMGTGAGGINSSLSNHANMLLANKIPALKQLLKTDSPEIEQQLAILDSLQYPNRFNMFAVSMLMPNAISAYSGIKLSLNGPNNTVALACAAGTAAIGQAFQAIKHGQIDSAICGGSEYLNDPYGGSFRGFDIAKTLTSDNDHPDQANRPFDQDRKGFLCSEGGAATLILEEYEHAVARQAPVLAELVGYGESFDSYNMLRPAPDAKQANRAIEQALAQANLSNHDIDYINTHGTGTQANDITEASLIEDQFTNKPLVNTSKSLMGHTIGASGALEAAITVMSLFEQTTHVCHNLEKPIADLNFVLERKPQTINVALTQSFAFGGHNTTLVLKKA